MFLFDQDFFFFFLALRVQPKEGDWEEKMGEGLSSFTITILQNTTLLQPHETWRLAVAGQPSKCQGCRFDVIGTQF